jgi:predicted TIM-barrel fold metal-dependent hydrolase
VAAVAERIPELRIVLNHTGFTQAGIGHDDHGRPRIDSPVPQPHEAQVLALSRHPNISVV